MIVTNEMNNRLPFLREKTSKLTTEPGCYIMKNKSGKIIYIGKAKNLKNRVTSYFRENFDHLPKVAKMVSNVYDYDFIVTSSEFEALVLECSLIKQNQPKYNILLKDDKGYSYIKISDDEYPKITAELKKDGEGSFLGPFTSFYVASLSVEEANRVFMLPTCKRKFPQEFGKGRPCLNFFIKKCIGLCQGNLKKDEYCDIVNQAVEYIKNGSKVSVESLTEAMEKASEELNFELAAKLRDRIIAIKKATDKQTVRDIDIDDVDCIGVVQNGANACASVIMYRNGRLVDKVDYFFSEQDDENKVREDFIVQFYSNKEDIPREIVVDEEIENLEIIEAFLKEKAKHTVKVLNPKRGELLRLSVMAKNNASEYLSIKVGRTGKELIALEELGKLLGLSKPPQYIECYDISNLASSDMVAGMVVFENGRPNKKAYKKFSIKTVFEQNDYACMQEVLERRFNRYFEGEDEGFSRLPDLILLDGGRGHVGAVQPVLEKMGIDVPLYGLVKDSKHRTRAIATSGGEISVSNKKSAFSLITRIQDEVHRFSITYQANKHKKSTYNTEMTKVRGIGEAKAKKIMLNYKTKEALKNASVEDLAKVAGVNLSVADELHKVIEEM